MLGNYYKGEKKSLVIMDKASTHICWEVVKLIGKAEALLLYAAPYSPDLSPIEYGCFVYKLQLKRYAKDFHPDDWMSLHFKVLMAVSHDTAIKEFRKCQIPFSENVRNKINTL